MVGSVGFRVQVQDKTLGTGQCRVKPSTVATVIGSDYVSAAAGAPVILTLTDASDTSEWQAQLAWDGVKHYVVNGLEPWLAHCSAKVGEAVEIFREANDPRLYVLLVRREVCTTASAPSGPDAGQQQLATQHDSMPVTGRASEGEAAAAWPAGQHTRITGGATAPVPALHAAGPQALPPAPAAAAAPAEGVQGAQAGASMPEPRSYGTAAAGHAARGFNTGLATTAALLPHDPNASSSVAARCPSGRAQPPTASFAWQPGTLLPMYAAAAVPQQLVPVVRVPWGQGDLMGGPPPAAYLWRANGHPYVGRPFRPLDLNQRPLIASQGKVTGAAGVHGSAGLGDGDGLRPRRDVLHLGHLLAATGMAAWTAGGGMAAGSGPVAGACGPVAAAGAGVRGYHYAPVGGAGADLREALPHAVIPESAQAGSSLGPLAEGVSYSQPEDGGVVAGAEDHSSGLWSRGVGGSASGGGRTPAARGAAGAPAPGTCSGGGAWEAAGAAAPDAGPGGAGAGVAMRARFWASQICVRRCVVAALWPGLAEQMRINQREQRLLYTGCASNTTRPTGSGAQQPGHELCVHLVTLVRYKKSDYRLTGVMAALRALGVGEKEAVGLRRLPCGRVLLERWQQQGQGQEGEEEEEEEDMQRAGPHDDETRSGEAEEGSDEEDVPSPKRRRFQGPATGGCGTGTGMWAQGQQGGQASVVEPQQGAATERAPVGPAAAAAAAGAQLCYEVPYSGSKLRPPVAAAHALWPQLIARLKRSPGAANSIQVTLHTRSGVPPRGPGQHEQQHAVQLSCVRAAKVFRLSYASGVLAALRLRGDGVLQLRRTPDGRVWAERVGAAAVTPAQQQPATGLAAAPSPAAAALATNVDAPSAASQQPARGSAVASAPAAVDRATGTAAAVPIPSTTALQQLNPARAVAFATDTAGIYDGSPVASSSACSPCASPAPSPDAPQLALGAPAAPSTTTTATTGPLCVGGGCLHPARPTVAALWPECVDMPMGTQQLVRLRAVVEPGGGGNRAAAGSNADPGRSVTHYGSQLARLGGGAWRLEGTQSLVRELRLGEGAWVQPVPLEGGVVGVRRAGAGVDAAGHRGTSGDRAAAAAAGEEAGGFVPAASAHAAWLKALVGAAYEAGWHEECVLSGADQQHQQQYVPHKEGQEQQRAQWQRESSMREQVQE